MTPEYAYTALFALLGDSFMSLIHLLFGIKLSVHERLFLSTRSAAVGGLVSTTTPLVASVKRLGQASALAGVLGGKIYGESDDQRNEECGQPHRNNRFSDNDWTIFFVGLVRRGWRLCENQFCGHTPKIFCWALVENAAVRGDSEPDRVT